MAIPDRQIAGRGWLLHSRPYRNSSLLVELFSDIQGRVGAVARGGRRDPLLQPFRPLQLNLKGRAELKTLQQVEPLGPALLLAGEALYCGLYVNELLMRVLHRDDPHPELMPLYEETLGGLSASDVYRDVLLRNFEFRLLDILGYGFSLSEDAGGQAVQPGLRYRLVADEGLYATSTAEFSGELLLQMAAGDWQPEVRRQARDLMRQALAPHLGGRPLASRELFRGAVRASGESE